MKCNTFQRILSFMLAVAMIFGMAMQNAPVVYATDTEPEVTGPTEPTTGETDPTETPEKEQITIDVQLENTKLVDSEGNEISLPWQVEEGSTVSFQLVPEIGCVLDATNVQGTDLTGTPGELQSFVADQTSIIQATSVDQEAPVIQSVTRTPEGLQKEVMYTLAVSDNLGVTGGSVELEGETFDAVLKDANTVEVSVSKNGSYTITIRDAAGLTATHTFEESQIDLTAPTISDPQRDTEDYSLSAKYSFTVTNADAGLSSVTVLSSESGTLNELIPDENGIYSFEVSENGTYHISAVEASGNEATKTVTEAKIDKAGPDITDPVRSTDPVTGIPAYTFQAVDTQAGVAKVAVESNGVSQELTADAEGYYHFTTAENGIYTITAEDNLGNKATKQVEETAADTKAPEISDAIRSSDGWSQSVAYTFTATDSGFGIQSIEVTLNGEPVSVSSLDDGYQFTVTQNGTYVIKAIDKTGNASEKNIEETQIDTTKPVISKLLRSTDGWADEIYYTFTVLETESGIKEVCLTRNGQTEILTADAEGKYTFSVTENGTYTVTAEDNVGNKKAKSVEELFADTNAPEISEPVRSVSGWATEAVYTFTVSDEQSGIQTVTVKFGETVQTLQPDGEGKYTFTAAADGIYDITATDAIGHSATKTVQETFIDLTPPAIEAVTRNNNKWQKKAQYSIKATDLESGIQSVEVVHEGAPITVEEVNGSYQFSANKNGSYQLIVTDKVGNQTDAEISEAKVDTTAPVVSEIVRNPDGWSATAQYRFTVKETQSGIKEVTVNHNGVNTVLEAEKDGSFQFPVHENGSYSVSVTDSAGNVKTKAVEETLIDTTAPVISAIVRSSETWATEVEYSFTVSDSQSGVKTVSVTCNGTEQVLEPDANGNYTFIAKDKGTYTVNALDTVGNASSRTVTDNTIDLTTPVIESIIRKNNGWVQNTKYEIIASDAEAGIQSVAVSYNDTPVAVSFADGIHTFHVSKNGIYTITVTDMVGHQTVESVNEQLIDTTAPVLSELIRSQNGWATEVMYRFTVSEEQSGIKEVVLQYNGEAQVLTPDGTGSYSFTVIENAEYSVTATDNAGNVASASATEEYIDRIAPVFTNVSRDSDVWVAQTVYSFRLEEPASGIQKVTVAESENINELEPDDKGVYTFTVSKNGTYTLTAIDNMGNTATKVIDEALIDLTAPDVSGVTRSPDVWSQTAKYTFSAADTEAGIQSLTVTLNGIPVAVDFDGTSYSFSVTENGEYIVTVIDKAGHETVKTIEETLIDTDKPMLIQLERSKEGWATEVVYSFTITETQSGIKEVILDNGTEKVTLTADTDGSYSFPVAQNGTYIITATDFADNVEVKTVTENHIDTTAPDISEVIRATDTWADQTVYTFSAADSQSGIQKVTVSFGPAVQTLTADENGKYSFTVAEKGEYTIMAVDAMGNTATTTITDSLIDLTPPDISDAIRSPDVWSQSAKYTFNAADTEAGIQSLTITLNGTPVPVAFDSTSYSFTVTENGEYTVTVIDKTGHKTVKTINETLIDRNKPIFTDLERSKEGWATEVVYSFTITETQSGIKEVLLENGLEKTILTADSNGGYSFPVTKNGSYVITVIDNADNVEVKTVTENFIDTVAPIISDAIRADESWAAKTAYTFAVTDSQSGIQKVTVSFGTMVQTLTAGEDGKYSFPVKEKGNYTITAVDAMGNTATTTVTDAQIDLTAPEIASVTRNDSVWLQQARYDIVTTDTEAGIAAVAVKFGESNIPVSADEGKYFFLVNANGTYIVTVTDKVGHASTRTVIENRIDTTKAEISSPVRNPESWIPEATYTFTASDTQSGVKEVLLIHNGNQKELFPDVNGICTFEVIENGRYMIQVTDHADNVETKTVDEAFIDRIAPVILSVMPQTGWDAETNTVTVIAQDNAGIEKAEIFASGQLHMTMAFADGNYTSILSSNGTYTVRITDYAGNTTEQDFEINRIDTQAPSVPELVSTGEEKWVNTDVTVTAASTDTQSGVAAYWYTDTNSEFNKNVWKQAVFQTGNGSIHFSAEQDTTYRVVAEDAVGRVSDESKIRVAIDKTAPESISGKLVEANGFNKVVSGLYVYNDTMQFQAAATDSASGVCQYQYRITGEEDTAWETLDADEAGIQPIIATLTDGVYGVKVKAKDVAGNWTNVYTVPAKFALEQTPASDAERMSQPELAAQTADGEAYTSEWTKQDVTVFVSGSGAASGIAGYEYRLIHADPALGTSHWNAVPVREGKSALTVSADTNAVVQFRAITNADNRSKIQELTVKVQKTAPKAASITFDAPTGSNGWHTRLPQYQISLPLQNNFFAPVRYEISYAFNGKNQPTITYDGENAPKIDKDGLWQITVTAVDAVGNTATVDESTMSLRVDTQTPIDLDVLLNGSSILTGGNGALTWDGVNVIDNVVLSYYTIYLNNSIKIQAAATGGDSGLAAIYYMVLPENEAFSIDGSWTQLTEAGITLQPDRKCNLFFKAVDNAGNIAYFSGKSIILDGQAPTGKDGKDLTIKPRPTNLSGHGYYNGDVTLDISVQDPVAEPYTVFSGLKSITYRVLRDGAVTQSGNLYPSSGAAVQLDGREQAWNGTLVISGQKNNSNQIAVEVTAVDMAGNSRTTTIPVGTIKIDTDIPTMVSKYDSNKPIAVHENIDLFTGKRVLTVVATERNFSAAESYVRATDTITGRIITGEWVSTGNTHSATITVAADGCYEVTALIRDLAGNETANMNFIAGTKAATKFILDNTNPTIIISYDNNSASQGMYFNRPRTVTVTVKERNFDPSKIQAQISLTSENGAAQTINLTNWTGEGEIHTATYTCNVNGSYTVTASGEDAAAHKAVSVGYAGTAPTSFVIDQGIEAPKFTGIRDGGNYSGGISPMFTVLDKNLDAVSMKLTWTDKDGITKDMTEELLGGLVMTDVEGGKHAELDVFPNAPDGIYVLSAKVSDKAGNTAQTDINFSVNRNGSVYVYDKALVAINGTYRHSVDNDLIITEYNASGVVEGSERVFITRNGEPVAAPIFTVKREAVPDSWQKITFTIAAENFAEDGIYTVAVSTEDAAGNIPENTKEDTAIQFSVDTTAPEITSVAGMEESIYKADSIKILLSALDNVALHTVEIYVDGVLQYTESDINTYAKELEFKLGEGFEQHIRIVITDMAGNILDTDAEGFNPGYGFQDKITVSSNFWLRLYANKVMFSASIVGTVSVIALIIFFFIRRKRNLKKT